jgi:hypothetical protein
MLLGHSEDTEELVRELGNLILLSFALLSLEHIIILLSEVIFLGLLLRDEVEGAVRETGFMMGLEVRAKVA